jgi:hypothetical protein
VPTIRQRDPSFCFNHPQAPRQHNCAECSEPVCGDCTVVVQGRTLCGPCKNFHFRNLQRSGHLSILAILAPIVALVGGPVAIFVMFFMIGFAEATGQRGNSAFAVALVVLVGMGLELLAFSMGAVALRHAENNPRIAGKAMAITGMVAGAVGAILLGEMAVLAWRAVN